MSEPQFHTSHLLPAAVSAREMLPLSPQRFRKVALSLLMPLTLDTEELRATSLSWEPDPSFLYFSTVIYQAMYGVKTCSCFCVYNTASKEQGQLCTYIHVFMYTHTVLVYRYVYANTQIVLSFPSHLLSSHFCFSRIPSRSSDPGSHSRLFFPPPQYGSCLAFLSRADLSSFFSRRLASNCSYPRYVGALSSSSFSFFFCK